MELGHGRVCVVCDRNSVLCAEMMGRAHVGQEAAGRQSVLCEGPVVLGSKQSPFDIALY